MTCLMSLLCIAMSNQELVDAGMKRMDETDQAIERSKQVSHKNKCYSLSAIVTIPFGNTLVPIQVVEQTLEVGTQTAATLKGQVINNAKQSPSLSLLKSYE